MKLSAKLSPKLHRHALSGILPRKDTELISLAVNAACTNLSEDGTRRHIRGALAAGATRDEIMMSIKAASLLSIHTCSLGAPILLEEAKAAGIEHTPKEAATPVCSGMQAAGQWNTAWDEFFEIDPAWTEAIIAASLPIYTSCRAGSGSRSDFFSRRPAAEAAFGGVVVQRDARIAEKARQPGPQPQDVRDRFAQAALGQRPLLKRR